MTTEKSKKPAPAKSAKEPTQVESKNESAPKKATKKPAAKRKPRKKKGELPSENEVLAKLYHDEDGCPCLTELQLLSFLSTNAMAELAQAQWQGAEKDITILLQDIPQYKKLRLNADAAKHAFQKKSRDYMSNLDRMSAELGIDMTRCIISDHTGRLTFVDEDGKPCPEVPIFDPKKKR